MPRRRRCRRRRRSHIRQGISSGALHPFAGPIRNQAGEVAVAEGETLPDEALLKMDWYVQGVQGKLAN